MKTDILAILITGLIFAAFIGLIFGLSYLSREKVCMNKWSNFEPEYTYWGGCKVKMNNKLVPADTLREVN